MAANVYIESVTLSPNPVETRKTFLISVDVRNVKYVLGTGTGKALDTGNGAALQVKEQEEES